jgi:hypothetical protein
MKKEYVLYSGYGNAITISGVEYIEFKVRKILI